MFTCFSTFNWFGFREEDSAKLLLLFSLAILLRIFDPWKVVVYLLYCYLGGISTTF